MLLCNEHLTWSGVIDMAFWPYTYALFSFKKINIWLASLERWLLLLQKLWLICAYEQTVQSVYLLPDGFPRVRRLFCQQWRLSSDWHFAQADLYYLFHTIHFNSTQIILRSTMCTDPGVSYRNDLGTCIFVREAMEKKAHGYAILRGSSWLLTWRKQRKRSVINIYFTYFCI